MSSLGIVRAERWWGGKIAPLVALAALVSLAGGRTADDAGRLVLVLLSAGGVAVFGHVLNDLTDRSVDQLAGKPNAMVGRSSAFIGLLLLGALAVGITPWLVLDAGTLIWALLAAEVVLLVAYSVPPVRLKGRGLLGASADAAYAYVVPMLLVAVAMGGSTTAAPVLVALAGWSALVGLRGILCHQVEDLVADRVAGVRTVAVRWGPEPVIRFVTRRLLPFELLAATALLAMTWRSPVSWLIPFTVGYALWRWFQVRRLWVPPLRPIVGDAAAQVRLSYVLSNELVERWLPLVATTVAAIESPAWWPIVALIAVSQPNALRELLVDDLRRLPDAMAGIAVDASAWWTSRRLAAARRRRPADRTHRLPSHPRGPRRFVFVVCGGLEHLDTLDRALAHLRPLTDLEVWVVTDPGRNDRPIDSALADRMVEVATPAELDHHQASIWLKTSLPTHLPDGEWCYLDTDVLAVAPGVEAVFDCRLGPVCFASDMSYPNQVVDCFSPWAMDCGCLGLVEWCPHLREAIEERFGVAVPGDWLHWNGGVFVFGPEARPLMDLWHRWAVATFAWPEWRTRDQGALIAAAWALGLQDLARLPSAYNFIADLDNGDLSLDPARGWAYHPGGPWVAPRLLHLYTSPLHDPTWSLTRDVERVLLRRGGLARHEERKRRAVDLANRIWWHYLVTGVYRRILVDRLYWHVINRAYWRLRGALRWLVIEKLYWDGVNRFYWRVVNRAWWSLRRAAHHIRWRAIVPACSFCRLATRSLLARARGHKHPEVG